MAIIYWVRCIYKDGWHNAFTDLQWFKGKYYACFRNALSHISPEGKIVVIASSDLYRWERIAIPVNTSGDDRDPHLIVAGDRLYVIVGSNFWGNPVPDFDNDYRFIRTYCSYTNDGINWSKPKQIYQDNYWVWGVGYEKGIFYGLAYGGNEPRHPRSIKQLHLVNSLDGLEWEKVSQVCPNGSEATFRITDKGNMRVAIRDKNDSRLTIAEAKPPFYKWDIADVDKVIPSPKLFAVGGREYLIGRRHLQDPSDPQLFLDRRTSIWQFDDHKIEHILDLPSSGDTSYAGVLLRKDGTLIISYYSQHDIKYGREHWKYPSNIYLAQIQL